MTERERDRAFMARCLELAEAYRGKTSPNPIVGCVIVDQKGRVIAEGAHAGPGTDHGERAALRTLRDKAKGATLYVNLEPCNHHGRTPPCAPLVRDSGVARVVIGALDPIPGHAGGAALLKKAGIAVTTGVLREACERANLPFFTHARLGRPAFTLKAAVTLDGKIATVGGESKWITGDAARADVMQQRAWHDAILVGSGTVLADDPKLTARIKGARDPIRIVLDRRLRTPDTAQLLPRGNGARTIIVTTASADPRAAERLERAGAEIWRVDDEPGTRGRAPRSRAAKRPANNQGRARETWGRAPFSARSALDALAERFGAEGIQSVLVEGGGAVHAAFLAAGLADRIVLYIAPRIVGGPAPSWVGGAGVAQLVDAYGFTFDEEIAFIGGDLRIGLSAPRRDSR